MDDEFACEETIYKIATDEARGSGCGKVVWTFI
jgi:hypothetical protein